MIIVHFYTHTDFSRVGEIEWLVGADRGEEGIGHELHVVLVNHHAVHTVPGDHSTAAAERASCADPVHPGVAHSAAPFQCVHRFQLF